MSPEVCPFCGKTYKRLKSHLPHCKAAARSETPPTKQHVSADQTSPSQLAATPSKTTAMGRKSTQKPSAATDTDAEEGKVMSLPASSSSLSSSSLLPSTKKKQKQAGEIKTNTSFLSPSPNLSSTTSKPKKKSVRSLIENTKAEHITKASLEGTETRSVSKHSKLSLKSSAWKETETTQDKDTEDSLSLLSADATYKDPLKKKVSKMKKILSTTQHTSDSLKSSTNDTNEGLQTRRNSWEDSEEESKDVSVNKLFLKSRSSKQVKVTLQDVKATLGRANTRQSSRPSILSNIQVPDSSSRETRLETDVTSMLLPVETQKDAPSRSAPPAAVPDQLPGTSPQHEELLSVQKKSKPYLMPLQEQFSASAPLLFGHASSQVLQATPPPRTISSNERGKVGHHMTGLLSISPPLQRFSSPLLHPPAAETLPGRAEELQLKVRKQNAAEKPIKGALTQQSLGQVRLRELPEWLACRTPSGPTDVVETVRKGWQWYYRRYIDVKKGGVGGLGMLLAGYCVLSYIWSYPHIKLSRWRKYH